MAPFLEGPKGSEKFQEDCTGENFFHRTAVSKIDLIYWSKNSDLDHFYVNTVMQDYTALEINNKDGTHEVSTEL